MGADNYGDLLILIPDATIFVHATADGPFGDGATTYAKTGRWITPSKCGALRSAKEIVFILDVTAAATEVGDILDVKIQEGLPGSGSIIPNDVVHFAQVLGNGGAVKYYAKLLTNPGRGLDAGLILTTPAPSVGSSANTITHGPITDMIRYVITTVDANANASFTCSLKAYVKG